MNIISKEAQEKVIPVDVLCSALHIPRATYYRYLDATKIGVQRELSRKIPVNSLNSDEKKEILDLLHSENFIDKTPYDLYYGLIDEGKYYCSPRTMYRILGEQSEAKDRRIQRNHRDAIKPELIATRPNEVWSWDITKLLGPTKWVYYHLYVILDIYSRYVVGWLIADCESKELARKLIQQSALRQGVQPSQLTLHSDNGPSMTSHTVSQLLEHLGVAKTHNRPYTSNDNPFSESQFKTLKYRPEFPGRCQSIEHAEAFCQQFFTWYNKEHYHSGIAWLTPESVHYQQGASILKQRHDVLMQAFLANPGRFSNKQPQLKKVPDSVYINPPQTIGMANISGQLEATMGP
ncbi:MAG: IS3 family transposase [Legionellales bacterium]|nr:IS3 family transposase [Legionellales bacterium]